MTNDNRLLEILGSSTSHLSQLECGQYLSSKILADFHSLQHAASVAGFELEIASGFRDFERQLAIWNNKFSGSRPVYDLQQNQVKMSQLNDWQKVQAILTFSALPGGSRHHWGTDFDFYDSSTINKDYSLQLSLAEYLHQGPFHGLYQWLQQQAKSHGFFFPYRQYQGGISAEPWHLSHQSCAQDYMHELKNKKQEYKAFIEQQDIQGKSAILAHFDEIFERYIVNICD